ncbi:peptidase inhibitor family I36 protein [Streptomyces sp. NPDC001536]|uniref:peptidase inhibitor family I36 protein n=1 Tax=Streptomyces sp. NPDC001536 TaxID=3364583 RepID=UPI0036859598
MSLVKRYASLVAAAVAAVSVGLAVPASAEAAPARSAFGEQVRAAGLSRDDADALQTKVDRYLARHDGRQVAANEIALGDGATLTVTVPGERYVRDLGTSAESRAAAQWECDQEYFCMYREQLGMGDRLALYYCQDYALQDWTGEGSYYNLQTRGTQALLKNKNRTVIHVTPGAPYGNPSYDWTPVWYVRPC